MPKFINKSQIIGEKGVAEFHKYCANQNPPIIWREETKNDFGIDGEIEIIKKNENGKYEVTGEILKVQLKSTETGSYISNETHTNFEYHASSDDITYWNNHKLSVLLVVFFVNEGKLYAKKVNDLDFEKSKKRIPIIFEKAKDELSNSDNNFLNKFIPHFRTRVNFDSSDTLYTNIFTFFKLPKSIYAYNSKVNSKKLVYDSDIKEIPEFILHSSKIYTFIDLKHYTEFSKMFVEESPPSVSFFKTFLNNPQTRNYAIELINKYLRDYLYRKGIGYSKDYNRFFFKNFNEEPLSSETKPNFIKEVYRVENYLSKKRTKTETEREVVTSYKYYDNTEFYRHLAFEVYYFLDNDNLNISITPKYLFTSNGKEVLSDKKKITRYTNYLTSREFNQQVLNHIYFIYQYLSENKETIQISNFENCTLSLSKMVIIKVPFSIDFCNKSKKKELDENIIQQRLFD